MIVSATNYSLDTLWPRVKKFFLFLHLIAIKQRTFGHFVCDMNFSPSHSAVFWMQIANLVWMRKKCFKLAWLNWECVDWIQVFNLQQRFDKCFCTRFVQGVSESKKLARWLRVLNVFGANRDWKLSLTNNLFRKSFIKVNWKYAKRSKTFI